MRPVVGRTAALRRSSISPHYDERVRRLSCWHARTKPVRRVLLAWLLVLSMVTPLANAHAQGDEGTSDRGLTVIGQYGGGIGAIAVAEPYAYLAVGPRLVVVDISDPRDAIVVGQTAPTAALAVDIVVQGDYAYVLRSGDLGIVDVADPVHPVEAGAVAIVVPPLFPGSSVPGMPRRVALADDYAFVAAAGAGLRIIDVRDPRRPVEVGAWLPPQGETEQVVAVTTASGFAYVGTQRAGGAFTADNGLHILDISNPAAPRAVSFLSTINSVNGIAVSGQHAYVAGLPLQVIDVADASNPILLHDVTGLFLAERVTVAGGYLYAGGQIFDLAEPARPLPTGAFPQRDRSRAVLAIAVDYSRAPLAVAGNYAVVVTTDGLSVLDLADRRQPREVAAYALPQLVEDLAVVGTTAYLGGHAMSGEGRIYLLDVADPAQPRQLGRLARPVVGQHFAAAGSWIYATSMDRLEVIDARDPQRPVVVGTVESQSQKPPVVVGDHVYIARSAMYADEGELQIVSVADPARPVEAAAIRTGSVTNFAVSGTHAYVLSGDRLRVIDVSDPSRPAEVAVLRDPAWNLSNLAVAGGRLYAIGNVRGRESVQLLIFDVSNSSRPTLMATHLLDGMTYALQIAAAGRTVIVASSRDLRVFDAADPTRLVPVASTARFEYINRVHIVSDQLYIAGHFLGLWILRLDGAQSVFGPVPESTSPAAYRPLAWGPAGPVNRWWRL